MDIGRRWRRLVVVCVLALSIAPWQAVGTSRAAQARVAPRASQAAGPSGQLVAYVAGGHLYTKPIAGGQPRMLSTP